MTGDPGSDLQGQPQPPDLLTVAEVARMLRVSKMTVYRMIHSGELATVKVRQSFRLSRNAVEMLLHEDRQRPRDPRRPDR
ncbi:MAG TPA: helix-turn-helix domain-containing protein [Pseudonocardia sp.]|jgi:excisionase family DNA binding protein